MGFFSGKKQTIPASGFYAQPQAYQNLYNSVLGNTNNVQQQINPAMFTPTQFNQGEQNAINQTYEGFTPDASQLQSDISMLQNPFDQYVVGGINREAQGQNSLVNQAATLAGQQGSNRSFLGTSDVEQNRLNNIGQFKQNQYNNAVNASLGALSQGRRADASGALQAGDYERQLAMQSQQAPLQAALAQQGLLQGIPTSFGDFGSQQQTIKTGGGLGGILGGINGISSGLGGISSIAGFFSDRDLKQDIEFIGLENGHKIYKFAYKSDPNRKYIGVMAQEAQEINPKAVKERDGYLTVNYDMIGVNFREDE